MEYIRSKFFGAVRKQNSSEHSCKQENGSKEQLSTPSARPVTTECIPSMGGVGSAATSEFLASRNLTLPADVNRAAFRLEDSTPSTSRQQRCPQPSEVRSRSRGRQMCAGSLGKGLCTSCHGRDHHGKYSCSGTEPCERPEKGSDHFLKVPRSHHSGSALNVAYTQHDQKADGGGTTATPRPSPRPSPRDRPKSSGRGKKKKKRDSRPMTSAMHLGHPPRNRAQSFNFLKSSRFVVNRHAYCPNEPGVRYPPPPWEHGMRKRWCSIDRGTGGPPLLIPQPKKSRRKRMRRRVLPHQESFVDTPAFRHPMSSPMRESPSNRSTSPPKKPSPPRSPPRIVTPSPPPTRLPTPPRVISPPRVLSPPRARSPQPGPCGSMAGPCAKESTPVHTSDVETQVSAYNIPPPHKAPTRDVSCSSANIRIPGPETSRKGRTPAKDQQIQTGRSLVNVPSQMDSARGPGSRGPPPSDNMVQLPIVSSPSPMDFGQGQRPMPPALTYCPAALADPQTPRAYLAAAAVAAVAAAAARVCSPPPSIVLEVDQSWAQQHVQPPCNGADINNPHPCGLTGVCGCGRHGVTSQQRLLKNIETTLFPGNAGTAGTSCRSRREKSRDRRERSSSPSRRDDSPYMATSSSSTRVHPSQCDFLTCKYLGRTRRDMNRRHSPHNAAPPSQHSPHRQQGDNAIEQVDSERAIKCIHACSGCGLSLYATASDSSGGVIRTLSRQLREKNSVLCACPPPDPIPPPPPPPPPLLVQEGSFGGSQLCDDFRCDSHSRDNCRREVTENYRYPECRDDKIMEERESSREV